MSLSDKEVNAAMELYNRRCGTDPEFAKFAEENPIAAFDQMVAAQQAATGDKAENFPFPLPGHLLSPEELERIKANA